MAAVATPLPETETTAPVVGTLEDLDKALKQMGALDARIRKRTAERDDEVRVIEARYGKMILRDQDKYQELDAACQQFAVDRRGELLAGQKTKTLKRPSGEVQFVQGRDSIDLVEGADADAVIASLEKKGFGACVTVRKSLNRNVLRSMWDAVSRKVNGLVYKPGEETVKVKPSPVS